MRLKADHIQRRVASLSSICAVLVVAMCPSALLGQRVLLRIDEPEQVEAEADGDLIPDATEPQGDPAFEVRTFAGTRTVHGHYIQPDEQVVGFVLADSLQDEDWERVETEFIALRQGLGSRAVLKLAIAIGSQLRLTGPFRSGDQLRRAIRAARPPEPEPSDANDPPPQQAADPVRDSRPEAETEVLAATRNDPGESVNSVRFAAQDSEEGKIADARLYRQLGEAAAVLGCDWRAVLVAGRLPALEAALSFPSAAYLGDSLRTHRLRFSFMPLDGFVPLAAEWASRLTGGAVVPGSARFLELLGAEARFLEVEWSVPRPSQGFNLYLAELRDIASGLTWTAPSASAASGWAVPEPLALRSLVRRTTDLSRAVRRSEAGSAGTIRSEIEALGAVNPADESLLRASVQFYQGSQEWEPLSESLRRLSEVRPRDTAALANLGTVLVRLQRWPEAQSAFLRLIDLAPTDPKVSEALGRVYVRLGQDQRALELFQRSLAIEPANQALWFDKADAARRVGDSDSVLLALEKGVQLPRAPHSRRAELIRLYLDSGNLVEAEQQIEAAFEIPPDNAEVLAVFARFWEELERPEDALALWERAHELDRTFEPAVASSARIHFEQGRPEDAVAVAESGVEQFPDSVSLHLTLARSLEAMNRFYQLRDALRTAVLRFPGNVDLLEHRARTEDTFGDDAPMAYRALAESLKLESDSTSLASALDRGFEVSLRHNDLDQARWFAARAVTGKQAKQELLPGGPGEERSGTDVPGGMRALAYIANANDPGSPETFFRVYCRPLAFAQSWGTEKYENVRRRLTLYFDTVRDILSLRDGPQGDDVRITLSVKDKNSLRKTRQVLGLLGWRLRGGKNGYFLQPIESESGAGRQEIGSALEIDGVAIQEALDRQQDFTLRLDRQTAPLALGEQTWQSALYPSEKFSGGFAEAAARDPRIASVYLGISEMHPEAARALVDSIGLQQLVNRYSLTLMMHGSSLSVENGVAIVPGGAAAAGLWTGLVGARPDDPDRFLPRLLRKEDGRLLGYFSALSQLDLARRRFFTRSPSRFRQFFDLYKTAPEFRVGARTKVRESPFLELLRELPLGPEDGVVFPGGAEVWMVARGQADAGRLARKIPTRVVPEVEDDILVRLAKTRFQMRNGMRSQVDKFLAVSRIDGLRSERLDAVTALDLAQAFGPFERVLPYFTTLTGLGSKQVRSFKAFAASLESVELLTRNHLLAVFHALAEILCIGQLEGFVSEERAAELFGSMCLRLSKGKQKAVAVDTALETIEAILEEAGEGTSGDHMDRRVRTLLAVDEPAWRREEFTDVLRLQSVPSLDVLLQARKASLDIASGQGDLAASIGSLGAAISAIPTVEISKEMDFENEKMRVVSSFGTSRLQQAKRRIELATNRRKPRLAELQRLATNARGDLLPHVAAALTGIVYAYYLRPDDLPVAEDPLFLRKHEFFDLGMRFLKDHFKRTRLEGIGDGTGAFISGGHSGFAITAGHVAQFSLRTLDPDAMALAKAELGSLRATRWKVLRETDVRRFALTVLLGREWVVEAASDETSRTLLMRAVAGALTVNRTRQMLSSLEARDWPGTWRSFSLGDLYRLGRARITGSFGAFGDSPVTRALAALPADADAWNRLNAMGAIRPYTFGHVRPRIWNDGPYEEYERYLSDTRIAERMAELKLYLFHAADRLGVSVERLAVIAEPAAKRVLSKVQMGDLWDWRSVLRTYAGSALPALEEELAR